jgi:ATP-grasp ribosomal peptide maturase
MASRTVLVLTQKFDPTADHVVEELNHRGVAVFRIDAAEFPQQLSVSAVLTDGGWSGVLRTAHRQVRLTDVCGLYYRRPTSFIFPDGMSGQERRWAHSEGRLGFGGLLSSLPHWMNHPSRIAQAEFKPVQLCAANNAGLRIPKTIVTNDPSAARDFAESVQKVIYKPFSAHGITECGEHRMLYASLVSRKDHGEPSIRLTAHLFQEWVEHAYAVRLTVVDGHFFASSIHSGSPAAHIDWRSDYGALSYSVTEVPQDVRRGVGTLMRTLELRFGALDFLVTPGGEWVFLEINPNGQWAWIEEETGLPITSAIADALTEGPCEHP